VSGPSRPVLRYHGGKFRLAEWIVAHFPAHQTYVEPFAGAASVLLAKERSHGEVYNDLDGEVVNLFRLLQDERTAAELCRRVYLTPFSREEFRAAYELPVDQIDRARKMIVRAYMGFGSASMTRMHVTGFRANANRSGTTPAQDWASWPHHIRDFTERLRGVVIECKDARAVMLQHDGPATLHYVDPPYVQSTRSSLRNRNGNRGHYYRHEMDDADHRRLAEVLRSLSGMVILSGYACPLYDELYGDWQRRECDTIADGARPRTEVIWLNPVCAERQAQTRLFA
jgi:DNA adenine methylase